MSMITHNYVTALYGALAQPIVTLCDALDARGAAGPNDVQASEVENGYSCAIIALAMLLLESAANRANYAAGGPPRERPVELFNRAGEPAMAADLLELFVLRDVIAHNHLWLADIDRGTMTVRQAQLAKGYGDAKFDNSVDVSTRTTKRLGLDVFPTRVNRGTAVSVLKKVGESLRFLERRGWVDVSSVWIRTAAKDLTLCDWIDSL